MFQSWNTLTLNIDERMHIFTLYNYDTHYSF